MMLDSPKRVIAQASNQIEEMPWGQLTWQVNYEADPSASMTVGRCTINVGEANGRHLHPNCEEILIVVTGEVVHSWNDEVFPMSAGDAISIPRGVVHNARNVGEEKAEMVICFSSAHRETVDAE